MKRSPFFTRLGGVVAGGLVAGLMLLSVLNTPGQAAAPGTPIPHTHAPSTSRNPDLHHFPNTPASEHSGQPFEPFESQALQPCVGGTAGGYICKGIDLLSHMALNNFSSNPVAASNIWGYVDLDDNREYAIIGLYNGTAVMDITDPESPVEVGTIPAALSSWREVKVLQFYNDTTSKWDAYAYVTTESVQGLQIIDLTDVPNSVSLAATYSGISTAHTLFISNVDPATSVALPGLTPRLYLDGSDLAQHGMRILSLENPTAPVELGSWEESYMHDIQVLTITDERTAQCVAGHNPCEIALGWRGTPGFSVVDVTDPADPVTLDTLVYDDLGYAHSGWISQDGYYAFAMDEFDEFDGLKTTVRVFDLHDLTDLTEVGQWVGLTDAIDHNGYTVGDEYIMSNYTRGLTILSVSNPTVPQETKYFDTFTANDDTTFDGAWGVYPFLPSGSLIISDISGGLFVVRESPAGGGTPTPTNTPTVTPTAPTPTATATPEPTTRWLYLPILQR